MSEADRVMKDNLGRRHGMGIISAKLFNALVTGMTTDGMDDFNVLKRVGSDFKDVFSNKEFEGKDSNYPYSQEYFEKMKDNALRQIKGEGTTVVDNIRGVSLGGSSGSEAVRQARMNANDVAGKPNKVDVSNYDRN